MPASKPASIDEYIAGFPEDIQKILEQVRAAIKKAAPGAKEKISYAIPAFTFNKTYLLYFAAHKNHIGLYPVTTGMMELLGEELAQYRKGRGTLQFPLDKKIPLNLIAKIAKCRTKENLSRAGRKKK